MAGSFGGQLVALDTNDDNLPTLSNPLEAANKLLQQKATIAQTGATTDETRARTSQIGAQTDIAQATLPGVKAQTDAEVMAAQAAIRQQRNSLIADAAAKVDPNDPEAAAKWDLAMRALVDGGDDNAKQFIGRYSPALRSRVTGAYATQNPVAGAAAMGAGNGLPSTSVGDDQRGQWDALFKNMNPQQLAGVKKNYDAMQEAILRVQNAPNPSAQWDIEAKTLGHPDWVGRYNPLRLQNMAAEVGPLDSYLQDRVTAAGAGVPSPIVPQRVEGVNGTLYAIDPLAVGGPVAKRIGGAPDFSEGASTGISLSQLAERIIGHESGGNATATNPASSAAGSSQFLKDTWLTLLKQNRPDLTNGKTDAQIMALRSDPVLSAEMTANYAVQNAATLAASGLPVNATTLALAHGFGPGSDKAPGARQILQANPNTPLSEILPPDVMKANPNLNGQTAGGYVATLASKMGLEPVNIPGLQGVGAPGSAAEFAGAGAPGGGTHGSDYLKTLSPQIQNGVTAIAEGRVPYPTGVQLKDPYWKNVASAVLQYDPTFSASDYQARNKARQQFTSGKNADNIASFNTAIGHAQELSDAIGALGNTNFPWWNSTAQKAARITGNPDVQAAVSKFNTARDAYTSEMVTAFRGSGGAEADIQAWKKNLQSADSPQALHDAIAEGARLLASRIDAKQNEYNTAMGTSDYTIPGLTPHAKDALAKLEGGGNAAAGRPSNPIVGHVYPSPKGPVQYVGPNQWLPVNASH